MTAIKFLNMKLSVYYRFIAVVFAGVLLASCSASSEKGDKPAQLKKLKTEQAELTAKISKLQAEIDKEDPSAVKVKSKEVNVTEVKPRSFDYFVQTQGSVESENNILVSPKASGVITDVYVKEGQSVSKGQVLAQIDNSVLSRSVEGTKSQLALSTTVYNRQKNLWDQKIGTEVQFLQAKTNKESLERQLESIEQQLDMFRIKSPISGTVDELNVKVGESLSMGLPAARIINENDLKITARISEAYVTEIKKGNKVIVSVPELKKDIVANVTFVAKNIDPLSRTFNVEIKLPTLPELRPNMTATVKVVFETIPSALVVPINVIQSLNNEKLLYVAEKKGNQTIAKKKVVTIDGVYGNLAHVEGLQSGDKIITIGYEGLNDGDYIQL